MIAASDAAVFKFFVTLIVTISSVIPSNSVVMSDVCKQRRWEYLLFPRKSHYIYTYTYRPTQWHPAHRRQATALRRQLTVPRKRVIGPQKGPKGTCCLEESKTLWNCRNPVKSPNPVRESRINAPPPIKNAPTLRAARARGGRALRVRVLVEMGLRLAEFRSAIWCIPPGPRRLGGSQVL